MPYKRWKVQVTANSHQPGHNDNIEYKMFFEATGPKKLTAGIMMGFGGVVVASARHAGAIKGQAGDRDVCWVKIEQWSGAILTNATERADDTPNAVPVNASGDPTTAGAASTGVMQATGGSSADAFASLTKVSATSNLKCPELDLNYVGFTPVTNNIPGLTIGWVENQNAIKMDEFTLNWAVIVQERTWGAQWPTDAQGNPTGTLLKTWLETHPPGYLSGGDPLGTPGLLGTLPNQQMSNLGYPGSPGGPNTTTAPGYPAE